MSDDPVKREFDEQYDTHIEVALNPYGAWQAIQALTAERDALAEKLEKVVEALREAETAPEPDHHVPQFRHVMDVIGAILAQITGGKTDDQHTD